MKKEIFHKFRKFLAFFEFSLHFFSKSRDILSFPEHFCEIPTKSHHMFAAKSQNSSKNANGTESHSFIPPKKLTILAEILISERCKSLPRFNGAGDTTFSFFKFAFFDRTFLNFKQFFSCQPKEKSKNTTFFAYFPAPKQNFPKYLSPKKHRKYNVKVLKSSKKF